MSSAGAADLQREIQGLAERTHPGRRVEVVLGTQPQAAARCARPQPLLPAGARLWGRTTLAVRCAGGGSSFVPVTIRVFGRAPLAARPLATGETLAAADLRMQEIDLTRYPPGAIVEPAQAAGRQATRSIAAGEPLLAAWLRVPQVVAAGEAVKLVYAGPGFSISTDARALSQAVDGQPVRVQTESGKTLSGIARPGRIVELSRP